MSGGYTALLHGNSAMLSTIGRMTAHYLSLPPFRLALARGPLRGMGRNCYDGSEWRLWGRVRAAQSLCGATPGWSEPLDTRHVTMQTKNMHDDVFRHHGIAAGRLDFGWLTRDSTPAERLNMAFKSGRTGRESKSGCIKARYWISARFPASGQIRIFRSGRCSPNVSHHALALPICLSRSTMSSAVAGSRAIPSDCCAAQSVQSATTCRLSATFLP